jgi:nitrite reductase/ring-hydroxylating ferredoxin subunit
MSHLVPVGQLDEIPPGKGKTLLVEGREITVYNQEGRLFASATMVRHASGVSETTCTQPGHRFDLGVGYSPDRLKSDELHYEVHVREGLVFVLIEEGASKPGDMPHRKPRGKKMR